MADLSSAHDSFVRAILADRQLAADYFHTALPDHLVEKLDFSTLQQQAGSYLSGELRRTISDVVYSCHFAGADAMVEVCLLVEHKSYRDKYTPLQIGSYLYSGYLQQVKQGRKQICPIIPVLFYHGKQKWEYHTTAELFGDLQTELLPYIPDFQYIYHNLREQPDEDLRTLDNRFLAASLFILKYSFDKDWLQGNFTAVLSIGLAEGSHDLKQALLLYFLGRMELPEEQVKLVIQELPSSIQEDVMSTYEMILEKGRMEERARLEHLLQEERARAEAELAKAVEAEKKAEKQAEQRRIALQFRNLGMAIAEIAQGTGLSAEEIENLK